MSFESDSKADGYDGGITDDEHPDDDEDGEPADDEDAEPAAAQDVEQAASEDGDMSDNAIVPSANLLTGDQGARTPPAAASCAANDQPVEAKRETHLIIQSNQRLRHQVDEDTELIVKFHASELEQIRASAGGEIIISVMPREEDGYWPTIGTIKRLFPREEGPAPDDAEEPPQAAAEEGHRRHFSRGSPQSLRQFARGLPLLSQGTWRLGIGGIAHPALDPRVLASTTVVNSASSFDSGLAWPLPDDGVAKSTNSSGN